MTRTVHIIHIIMRIHPVVVIQMVALFRTKTVVSRHVVTISHSLHIFPSVTHIRVGILQFQQFRFSLYLVVHVILDHRLAILRSLGGHKNHTIRTTSTVNGSGRCIFQHVDALDIVSRNVINGTDSHTVNNEQRVVRLGDGTTTSHTDGHLTGRTTILSRNLHTRQLSLQRLSHIGNRNSRQLIASHRCHSACQVSALHRAVTHHHRIFQCGVILLHDDVHVRRALQFQRLKTNICKLQRRTCWSIDTEITIKVSHSALPFSDNHIHTRQRVSELVFDGALKRSFLGKPHHSPCTKQHGKE